MVVVSSRIRAASSKRSSPGLLIVVRSGTRHGRLEKLPPLKVRHLYKASSPISSPHTAWVMLVHEHQTPLSLP